jgi:glyoxylate reductase
MKQTVVFTSELPSPALAIASQENEVIVHPATALRSEEELIELFEDADGVVTLVSDPVTRRVIEANPHLRVISNFGVGTNNIDLEAAREQNVVVTNTPGVLTDATADLTMGLLLAVTRRLRAGEEMVRAGRFTGWNPMVLLGTGLTGKQLGIIGMGRIGQAVARRAAAFRLTIAYNSPTGKPEIESELGAQWMKLDALLATSDFISIHAPLTPETHHLINRSALKRMKPTAYLINTSRGPLVDEAALAAGLAEQQIAGAALDVYEHEPAVEPSLLKLENVVLLPHLGSATVEARSEMARLAALNCALVLRGSEPLHRVV